MRGKKPGYKNRTALLREIGDLERRIADLKEHNEMLEQSYAGAENAIREERNKQNDLVRYYRYQVEYWKQQFERMNRSLADIAESHVNVVRTSTNGIYRDHAGEADRQAVHEKVKRVKD